MSQITIERSARISASTTKVWENVVYFKKQQEWFPWYIIDSQANLQVSGTDGELGAREAWSGEIIGTGTRTNTNILPKEFLDQNMEWRNRFYSLGRIYFSLQKCGATCTTLLCGVQMEIPWYKWFMKKYLCSQIGLEIETGLDLLSAYMEGKNLPKISENASKEHAEVFTLGIERTSTQAEMSEQMSRDFESLWSYVTKQKIASHGARSYYMSVNMKKDIFVYRSSIILSPDAFQELDESDLPEDMRKYYYPAGKIYSIRLTGAYSYLKFAWSVLFRYIFRKNIKIIKKYPMYEDYVNDPKNTPEYKRITDICCYVK